MTASNNWNSLVAVPVNREYRQCREGCARGPPPLRASQFNSLYSGRRALDLGGARAEEHLTVKLTERGRKPRVSLALHPRGSARMTLGCVTFLPESVIFVLFFLFCLCTPV